MTTTIEAPRTDVKAYLHPKFRELFTQITCPYPHDMMIYPDPALAAQFTKEWRAWVTPSVDLSMFPYAYLGNGSSELIRELAYRAVKSASDGIVSARPGEYEGWRYYVEAAGGKVQRVLHVNEQRTLYLSNPSAVNGNWIDQKYMDSVYKFYDVILDMAYINAAENRKVDVSPCKAVVFSASKSLGMFYHRVGIAFTKEPMPSLDGNNLWFHNPFSISLVRAAMEKYPLGWLHSQMSGIQREAVDYYQKNGFPGIIPSDTFLTAYSKFGGDPQYKRGLSFHRYCLFPYYAAEMGW